MIYVHNYTRTHIRGRGKTQKKGKPSFRCLRILYFCSYVDEWLLAKVLLVLCLVALGGFMLHLRQRW